LTSGCATIYNDCVDTGLYELVGRILTAVTFIAVGGALAVVFFFVFAQVILGSKRIQHKLESLDSQIKRTNELLEQISRKLGSGNGPRGD
jgi:ATP/ADP translocase